MTIIYLQDREYTAATPCRADVVVPFSGGKDSQTCLKLAINKYGKNKVIALFNDTGFEHPITYNHIKRIVKKYGVTLYWIKSGTVESEIINRGNFPNMLSRFCTKNLKIRPSKRFYDWLSNYYSFEIWYGMRGGESAARESRYKDVNPVEIYDPHEISPEYPKRLADKNIKIRLPILHWHKNNVFDFLDGEHNPLYDAGFDRVGCFPCLASGEKHQQNCFNYDAFGASQKNIVINLEEITGKKHDRANTDQICMFCQI